MALADSMLKYGMQKIKMSQASSLGNTISKIGDLGMEAGAALTKVAKATESNRKSYETIQTGKKEVGIDDEGSFLEKTGLKSSLNSDKSFDVNTGGGKKVSYDMRGLKQIGTLSSVYNEDYLVKKYGTDESGEFTDWKEKFGVKSYWDKFSDTPTQNGRINQKLLNLKLKLQMKRLLTLILSFLLAQSRIFFRLQTKKEKSQKVFLVFLIKAFH